MNHDLLKNLVSWFFDTLKLYFLVAQMWTIELALINFLNLLDAIHK